MTDMYPTAAAWPRGTWHAESLHIADEATGQLLNRVGVYFLRRGQFADAMPVLVRALAVDEQLQGPDHPDTARVLNNLGSLLQAQGDLVGARPHLQRALAIYKKSFGLDHPDIARSFNNLGWLLRDQGDL